ncbi:MAG: transpeptidase family protein [Saprospiraceae bacterium]|nr:transpeptidase family protein [Saprospiraceae bacterium]
MNVRNEVLGRVYIIFAFVGLVSLAIFSKAAWINVVEGDRWKAKGDSLYLKHVPIQAERGNILADNGSLLASALPLFDIRFDPNSSGMSEKDFFDNLDSLALNLAWHEKYANSPDQIKLKLLKARQEGHHYLSIARGLSHQEMRKVSSFPLFRKGKYKGGLIVERKSKRRRPHGILANRTIGYVRENAQPVGLEGYYDDVLSGKEGKRLVKRAGQAYIPLSNRAEIEPITGNDIRTTINVNIQDITETALINGIKHHEADFGTAIVMEVATGAVKAIANIKSTENGYWESYNYAVGTAVEPGSTFKLASIMCLLEDRLITLDDLIDIERGRKTFYNKELVDATLTCRKTDTTTIRRAFELSSNVGIAKLITNHYGRGTKAKLFIQGLRDLGLGQKTGISIEGEAQPYLKEAFSEKDDWSGISLPWISIGYESTITPLQLLTFYNGVANNGKLMKPQLVTSIEAYGEPLEVFPPKVIKQRMASPYTIQLAQDLLRGVVEDGTASRLRSSKVSFSGKTGTAQTNYGFERKKKGIQYRASFCGFFPSEAPKYSVVVMVENPKKNGFYGSQVAGPIFKKIVEEIFEAEMELHRPINVSLKAKKSPKRQIGARTDFEELGALWDWKLYGDTEENWISLDAHRDTMQMIAKLYSEELVPDVRGMGLRDALHLLEERGLKVKTEGLGKVSRQSIRYGTAAKGQTVYLNLN